jgi:hypothetical protein
MLFPRSEPRTCQSPHFILVVLVIPRAIQIIALYKSQIIPEVRNFHDILALYISKEHLIINYLSLDLAGDPNKNKSMKLCIYGSSTIPTR